MKKLVLLTMLVVAPMVAQANNIVPAGHGYGLQTPALQGGVDARGNINYIALEPLCDPAKNANCYTNFGSGGGANFPQYLSNTYNTVTTLGFILAVVLLTVGAVRYMLSDAFTDITKAKKQMRAALVGAGVVASSFLIAYTLNPEFLTFKLLQTQSTTTPTPAAQTSAPTPQVAPPTQQDFDDCHPGILRPQQNGTYICENLTS